MSTEPDNSPPDIPEHTLHRCIASGSYGEVWLARNTTGTWRAVKIVRRERFEHDRPFEREFAGLLEFEPVSREHPGLMQLLQVGRDEKDAFFYAVMELADDRSGAEKVDPDNFAPRTLQSELDEHGALSLEDTLRWTREIAEALAFLHDQNLVHRDIKPANIIFVKNRPKLADIGLVSRLNASAHLIGTHGYIPPEGLGQPPADVYALGKVLYETLTGQDRHAFPAPPEALRQPNPPPQLHALNQLILQACETQTADRLTASRFAHQLQAVYDGQWIPPATPARRLAQAALMLLALLAAWFTLKPSAANPSGEPPPPSADLRAGLILQLDFDGEAIDQSPHAHPVEDRGPVGYGADRHGKPRSAAVFDGNGTEFFVAPSPALESITNLTIAVWIRIADRPLDLEREEFQGLIDRLPEPGFTFLRLWNRQIDFSTYPPHHQTQYLKALPAGRWLHLAAVYDGKNAILYTNATEVARNPLGPGRLVWGNASLRIGRELSGSFSGQMDGLRLYNRRLNPGEIKLLAK